MTPNNKKHILSNKKNCSSCSVTAVTYLSNYLSKNKSMELVFLLSNTKLRQWHIFRYGY